MKLRDLVARVASKSGLEVREVRDVPPPPEMEWVLDVISAGPGTQVVVRVAGSEKTGRLVLIMPVGFSPMHRSMINGLNPEKRVRLLSRILRAIVNVCPYCRVGVGGSLVEPEGVVAEIHYIDRPGEQRLLDDITRLLSVFLVVNTVLWEEFPSTMQEGPQHQIYT